MESLRAIAGTSSTWGLVGFNTCLCRKSHFLIDLIGWKRTQEQHKIPRLTWSLNAKAILAIPTAVMMTTVLREKYELKNCIVAQRLTKRSTPSVLLDGYRHQYSSFA